MGFLKNVGSSLGHVDKKLLKTGLLARGDVISCEMTGMGVGGDNSAYGQERVCVVTVQVSGVPDTAPYQASCKHPIPLVYVPQMQTPGASVAVRVDPEDHQNIALDLHTDVPGGNTPPAAVDDPDAGSATIHGPDGDVEVPTHKSPIRAVQILEEGTPVRATLLMSSPLGQQTDEGLDVMGLVFTIPTPSGAPYQAQIGVGVSPEAMPLLYPNSELPAKAWPDWLANPGPPDLVTIDFAAALAEKR